jgi:uncharacterized protein (TIGR04255 family)
MTADSVTIPAFQNPPVVETVIGVQFAPIPGFTSGHLGWYWKKFLDSSWDKTLDAPYLADQYETFGPRQSWHIPPMFQISPVTIGRLQIINTSDDRVIQIQNTRFVYNWRKRGGEYPRFASIYPEFVGKLEGFRGFLREAGLADVLINQWEINYTNHLLKGESWNSPEEWKNILPGLFSAPGHVAPVRLESGLSELHFEIAPKQGRLHVSAQHGRTQGSGNEVLILQLTARGPVGQDEAGTGFQSGLEIGHKVLVRTFVGLASQAAFEHWGYNNDDM